MTRVPNADVETLAALARSNSKELQVQLKQLGITTMGVRMRVQSALLALPPSAPRIVPAAPPSVTTSSPATPAAPPAPIEKHGAAPSIADTQLLARITKLKEQGNQHVKTQSYVAACEFYREGVALGLDALLPAEALSPLLVSLHSNLCLCYIALQQWLSAKDSADAALALDPQNVKSLLRRGSCLLKLGSPDAGRRASEEPAAVREQRATALHEAKADFSHVAKLEPHNREARQGLKAAHVLLAHNHKFGGFLQTRERNHELAAEAAAAAAKPSTADATPPATADSVGASPYARMFAGEGLYADAAPAGEAAGAARTTAPGTAPLVGRLGTMDAWERCLASSASGLIVVDFTAKWCGPCQTMAPVFERLAAAFPTATFVSVDVDANQDVAAQQKVTALPTFQLLRGRAVVASMTGADPSRLYALVEAHAAAPPSHGSTPKAAAAADGGAVHVGVGVDDDDDGDDGPRIVELSEEALEAGAPAPVTAGRGASGHAAHRSTVVVLEDEPELDGARGYVQRPDGTTTTYFDRSTAHQATPSQPAPTPVRIGALPPAAEASGSVWNAAGTFEERDVSVWAQERLASMLALLEYDDDRELILEECSCGAIEGSASFFTARGKTRTLFELRFELLWSATVRVNSSKLCEGVLRCEASNEGARPTLEAKAALRSPVQSRDHEARVLALAEGGLKAEVMRAVNRFAQALRDKSGEEA